MLHGIPTSITTLVFWIGLFAGTGVEAPGADDKLYLVEVRARKPTDDLDATNLSPVLVATRDGGGVLKGYDPAGNPIISLPAAKLPEIRRSSAVRTVSDKVPAEWAPVARLKLSYRRDERPTDALLAELGLKWVSEYEKGLFMTVEPVEGRIDSALLTKLEKSPKLKSVTPIFRVRQR